MADENDKNAPSLAGVRTETRRRNGEGTAPGGRNDGAGLGDASKGRKRHGAASAPKRSRFEGERIAKTIARAGLCSRRDAEEWISEGRIAVNGRVLQSPAFNVTGEDSITVDGKPLTKKERTRLWLFHKPRGLMTTESDPEGRATIFDALPGDLPRVVTVGRLDFNTEGLMLLTNDGGLARALELPTTGWLRRYRVRANGEVQQSALDSLADGVAVQGVKYAGIEATLDRSQGANVWLTLGLREGKNREVKRVLEHLGLAVNRLIRISFGPFQLGDLAEGQVLEIRTRVLRDQLGEALAAEAGADFESPVREPSPPPTLKPASDVRSPRPQPAHNERADANAKRRHVSTLREERVRTQTGPRRRIERDTTADRSGRMVAVERLRTIEEGRGPRTKRRFAAGKTRNLDPDSNRSPDLRPKRDWERPKGDRFRDKTRKVERRTRPDDYTKRGGPDVVRQQSRRVEKDQPNRRELREEQTVGRAQSRGQDRKEKPRGRPDDRGQSNREDRQLEKRARAGRAPQAGDMRNRKNGRPGQQERSKPRNDRRGDRPGPPSRRR
jgi:23S rRNA pseudouridine2605 synthase